MKNQKQTKKNNGAKKPSSAKASTCAKATEGKPVDMSHRVLTMAEYRALEKAAHALETALKIRRKYQFAVTNATECVEKNLDKLMRIARGEALD